MKKYALLTYLFLGALLVQAQPVDELKSGNTAYQEERYEDAIALYEGVVGSGQVSATLFYNLGNSYYKTGGLARAILNYEKALRLNPSDKDARFNLKLANQQIEDRRSDYAESGLMGIWNGIVRLFSTDGWAWMSIIFFILVFFSFVLIYLSSKPWMKRLVFGVSFLWLSLGVFSVVFAQVQYSAYHRDEGVVLSEEVNVGSEPKESSITLFVLHAGSKVEILDRSEGWLKVKFDPEKIGWVKSEELEAISF